MMKKILIADDDPAIVHYLGGILKEKYDIFIAGSGAMVLDMAESIMPDLILLDVMMPDRDGFSTCRIIKSRQKTAGIPVIFITGRTEARDIVRGFEVGGQDYVSKPFNPLELHARINTHIELKGADERLRRDAKRLEDMNRKLATALARMELMAMIDPLTGIGNRRYFLERIEQEFVRSRRYGASLSIAMVDIDDYKKVNDRYGHECGDIVLQWISAMLTGDLRREDIIARWGGEEFILAFPETNIEGAGIIAEKLRSMVSTAVLDYRGNSIGVTVTIGLANVNFNLTIDENIRMADDAMYRGKRSTKNCIILADGECQGPVK
jgi:diguanylate cyclase (GGDEF)-like protein